MRFHTWTHLFSHFNNTHLMRPTFKPFAVLASTVRCKYNEVYAVSASRIKNEHFLFKFFFISLCWCAVLVKSRFPPFWNLNGKGLAIVYKVPYILCILQLTHTYQSIFLVKWYGCLHQWCWMWVHIHIIKILKRQYYVHILCKCKIIPSNEKTLGR